MQMWAGVKCRDVESVASTWTVCDSRSTCLEDRIEGREVGVIMASPLGVIT